MLFLSEEITIQVENLNNIHISYSIEENRCDDFCVYNLKVDVLNSSTGQDTIFIKGFTDSREMAEDIFYKLLKFKVTPVTLVNVLDDYFYNC